MLSHGEDPGVIVLRSDVQVLDNPFQQSLTYQNDQLWPNTLPHNSPQQNIIHDPVVLILKV